MLISAVTEDEDRTEAACCEFEEWVSGLRKCVCVSEYLCVGKWPCFKTVYKQNRIEVSAVIHYYTIKMTGS